MRRFIVLALLAGAAYVGYKTILESNGELVGLVNALQHPRSPLSQRMAAVTQATAHLQPLAAPDLLVVLRSEDLQRVLDAALKSATLPPDTELSHVALELREQDVVLSGRFGVAVPARKASAAGQLTLHLAPSVERQHLVLRPALSSVRVDRATYAGTEVLPPVAQVVNAALARFLDHVNGTLAAQRIALSLGVFGRQSLKDSLAGLPNVASVAGNDVAIFVGMGRAAVLVDQGSIQAQAEVVSLDAAELAGTVRALADGPPLAHVLAPSREQVAVLNTCGAPGGGGLPAQLVQALGTRCAEWTTLTAVVPPDPEPDAPRISEAAFREAFDRFRSVFGTKAAAVVDAAEIVSSGTVVAVSRATLAATVNKALGTAQARASLSLPPLSAEIPEADRTIRLPPAPDLKCDEAGGHCPSVFQYPAYNPRGCPGDCCQHYANLLGGRVCTSVDLGCVTWKPQCETLKKAEQLAYESARAAARAAWSVAKAACEVAKAGKIGGCRANQDWLNLWANHDVGEVRGKVEVRDIGIDIRAGRVQVEEGFDKISLTVGVSGGATAAADLTVVPHNAGNIVCHSQWSATPTARAAVALREEVWTVTRTAARAEGESLVLTYAVPPREVTVKLDPPPVRALLEQKGAELALKCPLPAAALGSLAGFSPVDVLAAIKLREEIVRDTFTFPVTVGEIKVPLTAMTLESGGYKAKLVPAWGARAILYRLSP